jgi:AcrR family transcriptional regulator
MTAHDATSRKPAYHHGDLRQALLTAAEAELAEKGVERFTLRGVAKRAGVSHAAPAHHFKDKDAMLTALAAVAAERFSRSLSDRQSRAMPDPRSQFVASGIGYVEFALKNPALFRLMFGSDRPDSDDPELNRHANDAFMNLVDGIAAISGGNPMESDEGLQDIAAAWSVVHGMANLLIAGRMAFIRPLLDADFDGTLEGIVGRIVRQVVVTN